MDWQRLESPAYWITFVAMFLGMALWETLRPARPWLISTGRRWGVHGVVLLAGSALAIAVIRLTPVAAAIAAQSNSWGLLNREAIPYALRFGAGFLMFDFLRYAVHRLLHTVPLLWRLHRVHHADPDYDITTSFRFHPAETLLQRGFTVGAIFLVAPLPESVLAAETVSCFANFFDHANANLPAAWETRLRPWFVTPLVHRTHHSDNPAHYDKNLGELFPWWDRLFGTYVEPPPDGRIGVGLPGYGSEDRMSIGHVLIEPFRRERKR
jgi:sterol desaturase/sphingolipid hydroxylase (fatty acid hydroxylase superfamily)